MPRDKRRRSLDLGSPSPPKGGGGGKKRGGGGAPKTLAEAMALVVNQLRVHPLATPFNQPVTALVAPDYADVVATRAHTAGTRAAEKEGERRARAPPPRSMTHLRPAFTHTPIFLCVR